MKILFSQIKQLVPTLRAKPTDVAHALTITGVMVEKVEEVQVGGKPDVLLSLEVRQNRPDCLGVFGIAREVAAYFGERFVAPKLDIDVPKTKLPIQVLAKDDVRRVVAVKLAGVINGESPTWLVDTLGLFGMNSIDLLVDLSNYAMLMTGFPNHVFDADKVAGTLTWQRSSKNETLTTLDGSVLALEKNTHLVITDAIGPLVLASAVGGKRSAVSKDTKNVLIEVAVYNPAKLLRDAKSLNVVTEAGNRLQKELATEPARNALEYVIALYQKYAKASVASDIYDYYPKAAKQKSIKVPVGLPSQVSGIAISTTRAVSVLKHLGFSVRTSKNVIEVVPPSHRTDIESVADVVEEVIRMVGIDTIPIDEPPALKPVQSVTPKRLILENVVRQYLVGLGFDEIFSLPLVTSEINSLTNWQSWEEIRTQNSINEEFPVLRQTLISGLFEQEKKFLLKGISHVSLFQIGNVFGSTGKKYEERAMLSALVQTAKPFADIQSKLDALLRAIGLSNIRFVPSERRPVLANPYSCFDVFSGKTKLGIVCKLRPEKLTGNSMVPETALFEIDVDILTHAVMKTHNTSATEVTDKLVSYDVNIVLAKDVSIAGKLDEITTKIGKHVWSVEVVDSYPVESSIRYTVRVTYVGLSESKTKVLHDKIFA